MSNSDQRSKVTIEDLLQLKKTERPAADFWVSFERELRQKQLSALVEKRSWWQDLPQLLMRRAYLPIGATAILTFTLVSVKYYSPTSTIVQVDDAMQSGAAIPVVNENASVSLPQSSLVSSPLVNRVESTVVQENNESLAPVVVASTSEPSLRVDSNTRSVNQTSESPSARSIAANLAHFEQSEPELINAVLGSRLSSPRVQVASISTAELGSIPTNSSKRSRLLVAHYNDRQVNAEATSPDNVRERPSRRWSDDDASDRFSRIGLKGDQFSLKF